MKLKVEVALCAAVLAFFAGCAKDSSPSSPANPAVVLSDCTTWKKADVTSPFTASDWPTALVYDNKMWLIGGRDKNGNTLAEVWSSSNGTDWTLTTGNAAFGPRFRHASVVYNNKMWVIGGTPLDGQSPDAVNDVWSSSNGADWTLVTGNAQFGARFSHRAVVFNGRIYVMAGNEPGGGSLLNDVWSSQNGADWTLVTQNALFSGRNNPEVFVFNDKIWLTGGYDAVSVSHISGNNYDGETNDLWNSSNGADWTLVTGNAAFTPRTGLTAFAVDGKIFVGMGYDDNIDVNNDLWFSTDGKYWTLVTWNLTDSARMRARALVFSGKAWILGGSTCPGNCPTNEVYFAD